MLPWMETMTVTPSEGRYAVRSDGLGVDVLYTPASARVEDLYREVSLGRFDLYEVVPFGDDEMIHDAETISYRVRAGAVSHRLGTSGEDISGVDTGHDPLGAVESFLSPREVPEAESQVYVVMESSPSTYGKGIVIDLGGSDVAIGPESSTAGFDLHWSGPDRTVTVQIRDQDQSGEPVVVGTLSLDLRSGGRITVSADDSGQLTVTS